MRREEVVVEYSHFASKLLFPSRILLLVLQSSHFASFCYINSVPLPPSHSLNTRDTEQTKQRTLTKLTSQFRKVILQYFSDKVFKEKNILGKFIILFSSRIQKRGNYLLNTLKQDIIFTEGGKLRQVTKSRFISLFYRFR